MIEHSEVMLSFAKMLAESDKPAKNPYQEDLKQIEEKCTVPEEDLVEIAHPEPVYVAEALGDGGLVENQKEQHEKMMTVINRMPTGALLGTYAATVDTLVKMANKCDELGDYAAADELTATARKILALMGEVFPFDCGTRGTECEVSPLVKEAFSFTPIKWGIQLAGKIINPIREIGGDALSGNLLANLSKWFVKGTENATTLPATLSDVGKFLENMGTTGRSVATNAAKNFQLVLGEAGTGLERLGTILASGLEKASEAEDAANKAVILAENAVKNMPKSATEIAQAAAKTALQTANSNLVQASRTAQKLQQDQAIFESLKNMAPAEQATALDSLKDYQGVDSLKKALTTVANTTAKVQQSSAAGLSDTAFFKKLLDLQNHADTNPEALEAFMLNTDNQKTLQRLMDSPPRRARLIEILKPNADGTPKTLPMRENLSGVTAERQALILGLPTAALTTAAGSKLASMYGWFHKNDPEMVKAEVNAHVKEPVEQLRVYGPGQDIIGRVKTATDDINSLEQVAVESLTNNPQGLSKYVVGEEKALNALIDALNQWDTVVANAEDKTAAEHARQTITQFVNDRLAGFNELAGVMGVPTVQAPKAHTTTPGTPSNNVGEVQALLKIPVTNVPDAPTTQKLQQLEQEFNQRSKDDKWTGRLVNPATKSIIDIDKLKEGFERMKKY